MKAALSILAASASAVFAQAPVQLFPDGSFDRRWYADFGAITFGLPDAPHSRSPSFSERRSAVDRTESTRLVVRPSPPPLLLSPPRFVFTLQQFHLSLLNVRGGLARIDPPGYVYDGEPELLASTNYLPVPFASVGQQVVRPVLAP